MALPGDAQLREEHQSTPEIIAQPSTTTAGVVSQFIDNPAGLKPALQVNSWDNKNTNLV